MVIVIVMNLSLPVLDHPIPTTPTLLPPSNVVKLQHKHPINNQQQTTVYITKEVSAPPQTVAPQNGPQKIVIPISSLRSGGGRGVSTYPASLQEIYDNKEIEGEVTITHRQRSLAHDASKFTMGLFWVKL